MPQWPSLLPFFVGLAPPWVSAAEAGASNRATWRRMRGGVLRSGLRDCSLGFCALGLPPGSVLCALPERRFALRSMLGSATPLKLCHEELEAAERQRAEWARRRKANAERLRNLAQLNDFGATAGRGKMDWDGCERGACNACSACAQWVPSSFAAAQGGGHSLLVRCCRNCGCPNNEHVLVGGSSHGETGY